VNTIAQTNRGGNAINYAMRTGGRKNRGQGPLQVDWVLEGRWDGEGKSSVFLAPGRANSSKKFSQGQARQRLVLERKENALRVIKEKLDRAGQHRRTRAGSTWG